MVGETNHTNPISSAACPGLYWGGGGGGGGLAVDIKKTERERGSEWGECGITVLTNRETEVENGK